MPDERVACPSCGTAVADHTAPTFHKPNVKSADSERVAKRAKSSSQSPTSYSSLDDARFVSGTMFAERYRIIGLLGRGGMGEVYRADDLKLGQPVALKFLPDHLSSDGTALMRFHREVRTARQVSHRNVCRVYDVGERDQHVYLSMEYIKGEELSSLLRRIDRLPSDKALEIARQICAGLAAAHERGVLHRDLKPSNVMIDEEGNARITDFGLAGLAEELREEAYSGTPAYMSPEQLEGKELTHRSDLYSLGLVLYELFTGKRAFEAKSVDELLRMRLAERTPVSLTSLVKDVDPVVERVIERCLERDPERRPASALSVAASLPGGDPLAAALAAGETPSPEMVAAAPKEGSLRPVVAAGLLAASLVSLALFVLLSGKVLLVRQVPMEKPPEVLADRAATIVKNLGYADKPVDTAYGYEEDRDYYDYVVKNDQSMTRWDHLQTGRPALLYFWYRQSPNHLEPHTHIQVQRSDPPPLALSGMTDVRLDTLGRLIELQVAPPQVDTAAANNATANAPDWSKLFTEAGLDINSFRETEPQWTPPVFADARRAWEGVFPEQTQTPLRIEAASYKGQPVYFSLVEPWRKPARMNTNPDNPRTKRVLTFVLVVLLVIILSGIWMAKRNLELGRGDRRGAFKLALFVFLMYMLMYMLSWLLGAYHVPTFYGEVWLFFLACSTGLFMAGLLWLLYIALEPYVRRRTPHRIISWNRVLAGGWRDPLVGRDILIGVILGIWMNLFTFIGEMVGRWLLIAPDLLPTHVETLRGVRSSAPLFIGWQPSISILHGLGFTFLLFLLGFILKTDLRAAIATWLLFLLVLLSGGGHPLMIAFSALLAAAYVFVAKQFGLLALAVAQFIFLMCEFYPYTTDFSLWYSGATIFALAIIIGTALYGFYTSLAGQPLFHEGILKE